MCHTAVILQSSCFTFWHLWHSLALTGSCFSSCSHLWLLNGAGESPGFTLLPNSSNQIHIYRFGLGFFFLVNEDSNTYIANNYVCYLHKIASAFLPFFSKVFLLFSVVCFEHPFCCILNCYSFFTVWSLVLFITYVKEFDLYIFVGCRGPISSKILITSSAGRVSVTSQPIPSKGSWLKDLCQEAIHASLLLQWLRNSPDTSVLWPSQFKCKVDPSHVSCEIFFTMDKFFYTFPVFRI